METSNTESNQASSSLMVSEHETMTNGDLEVHSPAAINKLDVAISGKKLDSSPSSSSESPLENPFQEDNNDTDKPPLSTTTTSVEVKEDAELASGYSSEDNVSENSTPKLESPDNEVPEFTDPPPILDSSSDSEATTVSPPTQVMERESKYRIPSSVFARTKSNAPVDWSVASNESLFSIQMGNMSFIKEDFFWKSGELGMKSGELGMKSGELEMRYGELGMRPGELDMMRSGELGMRPGELTTPAEPSTSVQMFSYSQNPNTETTDLRKSAELGVAVETMKEVLRECADDQKEEKSVSGGRIVRNSDGSTSTKSFAFSA